MLRIMVEARKMKSEKGSLGWKQSWMAAIAGIVLMAIPVTASAGGRHWGGFGDRPSQEFRERAGHFGDWRRDWREDRYQGWNNGGGAYRQMPYGGYYGNGGHHNWQASPQVGNQSYGPFGGGQFGPAGGAPTYNNYGYNGYNGGYNPYYNNNSYGSSGFSSLAPLFQQFMR